MSSPSRAATALVALVALGFASPVHAQDAGEPLRFRADKLTGDLSLGELTLEGGVELAYSRYRLRARRLVARLDRGALVFSGDVRAALCPCPDPVLSFGASGGRIDPSGDLLLRGPRVLVGGVPVFALPVLWVRAPDHVGLLAPTLALRGSDGPLIGSGVRVPWRARDGGLDALELTAGAYLLGGAELGAHLTTESTETRVLADLIHGDRVELEAGGAFAVVAERVGVAWTLDAIRGDRALSGTPLLEPAARPFDTGAAEVSFRATAGSTTSLVAGGVIARALRGEGPIAAGPSALVALAGPLGRSASWSAEAAGAVLGDDVQVTSLGRAAVSAELDARPGPFDLRASAGGRARFADDPTDGPSTESATAARVDLELPFARSFASHDAEAPLVHTVTPGIALRGALAAQTGSFFAPIGGAVESASWLGAAGVSSALGRSPGSAIRLDVSAGATGSPDTILSLLHARLAADARLVAASIEGAATGPPVPVGGIASEGGGASIVGRARLGTLDGAWLRVNSAGQTGAGAGRARAVAWGAWAALPGDELAYLAAAGWTGGADISVPVIRGLRTAGRLDADLSARSLLAVSGSARYRHPCGCFGLGLLAGARRGRDGVDVALSVDLSPR